MERSGEYAMPGLARDQIAEDCTACLMGVIRQTNHNHDHYFVQASVLQHSGFIRAAFQDLAARNVWEFELQQSSTSRPGDLHAERRASSLPSPPLVALQDVEPFPLP